MERLNKVNMNLLLSALDSKRKDITVTKNENFDKSKKTNGNTVCKVTNWFVRNKKGQEIFSLKHENIEYEDGRFTQYDVCATLNIGKFSIVFPSKSSVSDTENFIFYRLPKALENKILLQEKEKKLQQDLKNMSDKDIAIKKYLENTLQK